MIGIILGPSFLHIIEEGEISLLAEMGAVLLLFTIGIESEVREIFNRQNLVIALGGVIIPFIFGYLISFALPSVTFWESIFIGIVLVATSVGITAKLLQELGLMNTKVASTIIGAAVVDDILGIIVLSIGISGAASGELSLLPLIKVVVISVAFIGISIKVLGKLVTKWMYWLKNKFGMEFKEVAILPMLIVAFFFAWVSEMLGLSIIIGAFTAGIMLPLSSDRRHEIKEQIDPIYRLLVPFFFIVFGVMVDLHQSYSFLWFGLLLSVVAILGKVIGCGLPSKYYGFSTRESVAIGFGMSPRGEVGLIVALVALNSGIIGDTVYAQAVFMSLFTLLISPMFFKKLLKK